MCWFFIDLPTAQAHPCSHVRNRVGDGMVAVIHRGGIPVEVGRAYVHEHRNGQEIPSLAVAVGREGLRGSESWNVRHIFGWAISGVLEGSLR